MIWVHIDSLSRQVSSKQVLEQAAIAGVEQSVLDNADAAAYLAKRLDRSGRGYRKRLDRGQ